MSRVALHSKMFRPADIAEMTGIEAGTQRDLRRRGYKFGCENEGWLNASVHDAAKLLLVKALRDAGLELSEAWKQSGTEVVGNIVFHALLEPNAIDSMTDGHAPLEVNPSLKIKWAMEFAAEDNNHVGGGDYFIFGPSLRSGQYTSIEAAILESGKGPHLVMHVVALRELSRLLARGNPLAYVEQA